MIYDNNSEVISQYIPSFHQFTGTCVNLHGDLNKHAMALGAGGPLAQADFKTCKSCKSW